ncbi:Druantia anti-phage system protein DruA [Methyloprofundus sp.]|uniref:Druantia anti-phage system protein DruA n=2 Tax=Methyloprofundus sp. TaxID=2020875 RepID=UPI003D1014EC
MQLNQISVRPILKQEEPKYQDLMEAQHYLGAIPKIGETLWYVAYSETEWIALISFSAAALKCAARDSWIGWSYRHQTGRLKLIANNSRFLILPTRHDKNLGSRLLSLCLKRLSNDWVEKYGHPILLVETFVDPKRFHGGVYRASNWQAIGYTKGFRRVTDGYSAQTEHKKLIFVKPLHRRAQSVLSHTILSHHFLLGEVKMKITRHQMRSLPDFFKEINDPRRAQGRRHRIQTVLGIAAGAVLCGMRSYESIFDWAESLSQKSRAHFRCRYDKGRYVIPSLSIFRNILVRVDPNELDAAFNAWNKAYAQDDNSLAIDGKVMCNAIDESGRQTQIMSAVGHTTGICYAQKK